MHRRTKLRLADLNPCLTCRLCGGYYVDACTIQECLHSFCKSCIVRYLETKKNCPVCRVLIHKTRPLDNVRPDPTLQDVVYKLVPGMLKNEMMRRRQFYADNPCIGHGGNPTWSEDRGDLIDPERAIFMEDDKISISLTHSPDGIPIPEAANDAGANTSTAGQTLGTTYLFCPAMATIGVLKKLIRYKYDLSPDDDLIEIFQSDESLSEDYTLMDIVYLYTWRRQGPLRLFFTIYKFRPVIKRPFSLFVPTTPDVQSPSTSQQQQPPPAAAGSATTQDEPLNMSKKRKDEQAAAAAGLRVGLADAQGSSRLSQGGAAQLTPPLGGVPQLIQRQSSQLSSASGEQQLQQVSLAKQPLLAAADDGCHLASEPVAGRSPRVAAPAVGSSNNSSSGGREVQLPVRASSHGPAASTVVAAAAASRIPLAGPVAAAIPVAGVNGLISRSGGCGGNSSRSGDSRSGGGSSSRSGDSRSGGSSNNRSGDSRSGGGSSSSSSSLSSNGSSSASGGAGSRLPESGCLDVNDNGIARAAAFSGMSMPRYGTPRVEVGKDIDDDAESSALNLCISKR